VNRGRALFALLGAAALAALAPGVAEAHLVATGMGPVYDGVSHFGLSPEDSLPVLALGLLAGLRGAAPSRAALAGVTVGWLFGGCLAMAFVAPPPILLPALTAALYLVIGGLLAANLRLAPMACAALGAVLGLVRGGADLVGVGWNGAHGLSLVGMAVAVFVLAALAASLTLPLRRVWMIVAARVGGSWLAALGLLLAGWMLRFGAVVQ
jgi:hypothetical protein